MKKLFTKLIIIVIWLIFTDAGEKTEWYIVFYQDENTVHKCSRDKYLEMHEFFELNEFRIDYNNYLNWEQLEKYENTCKLD
jgi:hypothetical protein